MKKSNLSRTFDREFRSINNLQNISTCQVVSVTGRSIAVENDFITRSQIKMRSELVSQEYFIDPVNLPIDDLASAAMSSRFKIGTSFKQDHECSHL